MYFRHLGRVNLSDIIARGQNDADFCASLTFNPTGTTNINWNLWTTLESYYSGCLTSFTQQVSNTEMQFASNTNNFDLLTWRQWDTAAPRVTATNTAVLAVTPKNLIAAGQEFSLGLTPDGKVVGWGWNVYGQTTIPAGLSNVVAIAAGITYSLALRADGTVIGWGYNYDGEATGVPNGTPGAVSIGGQPLTNVVAIAPGQMHSLALKADGTVVGWGFNFYGQTTIPAGLTNVVAIAAGYNHSLALKADGTVVGWGYNVDGEATGVPNGAPGVVSIGGHPLTNVVSLAAGASHSLALKADGTVVGWGITCSTRSPFRPARRTWWRLQRATTMV